MSFVVRDLHVAYGKKQVLHGVSLAIGRGELFSLLGPSGCGKSTLLKTMAGLQCQQSGSIVLDGAVLDEVPAHKRGIGMVFQDLRLFPHLTAQENVAFPLKMAGVHKQQRLRAAEEMLAQVQLAEYGHRRASQLSGGQQQRVVLARALMAHPKMLLLDEPFSGLDAALRGGMQALVQQLHQKFEMTTVLVTHDHREALMLSCRVAVMHEGRIVQCDTPQNLYNHPKTMQIAAYFVQNNRLEGEVCGGRFCAFGLSLAASVPNGRCTAVFRPEALSLRADARGGYTVSKIEYMGSALKIHIDRQGLSLAAKAHTDVPLRPGDTVSLAVEEDKVLYYPAQR